MAHDEYALMFFLVVKHCTRHGFLRIHKVLHLNCKSAQHKNGHTLRATARCLPLLARPQPLLQSAPPAFRRLSPRTKWESPAQSR